MKSLLLPMENTIRRNIMMLMNTTFAFLFICTFFRGTFTRSGTAMNRSTYLNISSGLMALPMKTVVISGVRPRAIRYVTVSARTDITRLPLIMRDRVITDTPDGTAASMTQPYHRFSLPGMKRAPIRRVIIVHMPKHDTNDQNMGFASALKSFLWKERPCMAAIICSMRTRMTRRTPRTTAPCMK